MTFNKTKLIRHRLYAVKDNKSFTCSFFQANQNLFHILAASKREHIVSICPLNIDYECTFCL